MEELDHSDTTTMPTLTNATLVSQSMSPETKFTTTRKRRRSWDEEELRSQNHSPFNVTEEHISNLEKQRHNVELSISNTFENFQSTIENLRSLLKEKDKQIASLYQQIRNNTYNNEKPSINDNTNHKDDISMIIHQKDSEVLTLKGENKQLKELLKTHEDLLQSQSMKLSQATKQQQSNQESITAMQSPSSSVDKYNEIKKLRSERSDMIKRLSQVPKLIKENHQLKAELQQERDRSKTYNGKLEQLVNRYNLKHNNIHDDESTAHVRKLLVTTRQSLERSVQKHFQEQLNIPLPPYDMNLKDLIKSLKERQVPNQLINAMHTMREYGNKAIHDENIPSREQVYLDLENLADLEDAFEKGLLR